MVAAGVIRRLRGGFDLAALRAEGGGAIHAPMNCRTAGRDSSEVRVAYEAALRALRGER